MAFPKLLQKLFQNNGAGTKLRSEILPDIPYSSITGAPTTDSALSATSTNPVQNKVIKAAIDSVSTSVSSSGYQVGDMKLWAGSNAPAGWFRCDGSTVANMQTNYPKLFAFLGTNVLPNYSVVTGVTGGKVSFPSKSISTSAPTISSNGAFYLSGHSFSLHGSGDGVSYNYWYEYSDTNVNTASYSKGLKASAPSFNNNQLSGTVSLTGITTMYVLIKHD